MVNQLVHLEGGNNQPIVNSAYQHTAVGQNMESYMGQTTKTGDIVMHIDGDEAKENNNKDDKKSDNGSMRFGQ